MTEHEDGAQPRGEGERGDGQPGAGEHGESTPGDGTPGDGTPGDGTPGDGTWDDGTWDDGNLSKGRHGDGSASGPSAGPEHVVVLGRAGVRTAYALLLAGVVVLGVGVAFALVQVVAYAAALTGVTAWLLFVRGADEVRLEADALVVRSGRRRTRYPWADVLEVTWRRQGSLVVAPGVVVRIRGGPFDEPGPNLPAQIASPPIFGRRAQAAAEAALRTAVVDAGVRFDPHMERDIAMGRRRPQDPERQGGG